MQQEALLDRVMHKQVACLNENNKSTMIRVPHTVSYVLDYKIVINKIF